MRLVLAAALSAVLFWSGVLHLTSLKNFSETVRDHGVLAHDHLFAAAVAAVEILLGASLAFSWENRGWGAIVSVAVVALMAAFAAYVSVAHRRQGTESVACGCGVLEGELSSRSVLLPVAIGAAAVVVTRLPILASTAQNWRTFGMVWLIATSALFYLAVRRVTGRWMDFARKAYRLIDVEER